MPSRDVEINLIGNDRTGAATRSAGNNLDQLARKIDKFNAKTIGDKRATVKTKVDNSAAAASANKLKKTFAKAGDDSGRSFTSRFQRAFARFRPGAITTKIRQVFKVDRDARRSGITAGSTFFRAFINSVTLGMAGGQLSAGMIKAAPKMAAVGTTLGATLAAAMVVQIAQAVSAALPLLLGAGLLAGPIAFLLVAQKKASDETKKQETAVAALRKRLNNATNKDTKERLQKQLAAEQLVLDEMRKESQQWDNLKAKAKAFMTFISAPLKIPLQDSINAIFKAFDQLRGPVRGLMAALGAGLAPLTKGIGQGLLAFINALKPALPGIVASFMEWGRQMPVITAAIGTFFTKLIGSPAQATTAVQGLANSFRDLLTTAASVIGFIQKVATAYQNFATVVDAFENNSILGFGNLTGAWRGFATVVSQAFITALNALDRFVGAWAKINPAMRGPANAIHQLALGAQADFAAVQAKWAATDASISRRAIKAKITANIADLQSKLAIAKAKLQDPNLTKAKKVRILANIADIKLKIATAKAELTSVSKHKTVAKLRAVKNDLEAKVRSAKASLKTVQDKKTRAKIQADIAAAQAKIRQIKAEIASIHGKTVPIRITVSGRGAAVQQLAWVRKQAKIGASAGAGAWQGSSLVGWQAALSGGAMSRTEPPSVSVAAPEVSTRVFLDSREIQVVARSTVREANSRDTWRARTGRR